VKVRVIHGSEISGDIVEAWEGVVSSCPEFGSPYFSAGFTRAVSGVRDDVFVGLMEEAGKLVGFFPFQRHRGGVGGPVGGPLSDYQAVIIRDEIEWDAAELVRACGLSIFDFDHLLTSQRAFQPYHASISSSPLLDLGDGFEAFASERREAGTKIIKKTTAMRRKLERDKGDVRCELLTRDSSLLRQLFSWKSEQYARSEISDVFSFAWTRRLLERILATDESDFGGIMSALYAGDQLISVHLGMRGRSTLHWWFPSYNRDYFSYSPGSVLLLDVAQRLEQLDVRMIDLGKGDDDYKLRFANSAISIAEGTIELPSLARAYRALRRQSEAFVRDTPLETLARVPGRLLTRAERKRRMR
jgi:CelD/BcsL family acetyltransferase involved in cellulose biosynthesis